ncbi:MAG: sugar phosphate isomerase/epimerase family protein [Leptothrix sp. (in: b-proteobacteria)]
MTALRFACSNLAWADDEEAAVFAQLHRHGVTGIEVAPTRLWPDWHGADPAAARLAAQRHADAGFQVASMQALLFGQPQAQLFGADGGAAFEAHLSRVAAIGEALGATAAVLGAPRNRQRAGLGVESAREQAVPILRRLAQRYQEAGVTLALEPARPEYGGDFVVNTAEALALVEQVGHPGLAVHLDAAAMHAAGEAIEQLWPRFGARRPAHYQLSEPGLAGFADSVVPQRHNLRFLQSVGWTGWCSVEMLRPPTGLIAEPDQAPWAILSGWQRD